MTMIPALLLQDDAAATGALAALVGLGSVFLIFYLLIVVVFIVGMWKVFTKAGQPGWAAIVPIYNAYILTQIAGRPGWWVVLMLVPLVNFVIYIMLAIDIAKSFGQGAAFGVILLVLLGGIGYLVLGFGNYRYHGPAALTAAAVG
jgi:hypothetical protein